MKKWEWPYWFVLIGYYTAAFFLTHNINNIGLTLVLPILVVGLIRVSIHKKLIDYLFTHHPEAWGRISKERAKTTWIHLSVLSFDDEIDDPDYETLRNLYRRIFWSHAFSICACLAIVFYVVATT